MKPLLLPTAGLALIASGFGAGIAVSATAADDPAPVTVTRQSLAEVPAPQGAPKRTLGLSKVVVMPGSVLASHHHPGDQLGYIAEGTLTYTVETGHAKLMKGPGDDAKVVRRIDPGETVRVKAGQLAARGAGRGAPRHQRRRRADRDLPGHPLPHRQAGGDPGLIRRP